MHLETQGGSVAAMDISAASWRIQGDGPEITGSDAASDQGVIVLSIDRSTGATQHWVFPTDDYYNAEKDVGHFLSHR